jgi:hypothetical protein
MQFWLSVGHFKHAFLFVQGRESFQVTGGFKRKLDNNMQWLANYVGHVCNQSNMVMFKPAKVCGSSSNSLWWWSKKNGKAMENRCLTGVFAWKKGTPKYPVVNRHPIPSRILHKMCANSICLLMNFCFAYLQRHGIHIFRYSITAEDGNVLPLTDNMYIHILYVLYIYSIFLYIIFPGF